MRISDWSSDVCSSDLSAAELGDPGGRYHRCGRRPRGGLPGCASARPRRRRRRPARAGGSAAHRGLRGQRQPGAVAAGARSPGDAMKHRLGVLPEVRDALATGRPVVALESTIITHGMPAPRNLETARRVEAAVRAGGAVPATIAVLDGRIRVGLTADDLERLAGEKEVAKASRADLPAVLASGGAGSTTVAATMICADLAGIRVFATGGISGGHRDAATSSDLPADRQGLASHTGAGAGAGAKAI